MNLRQLEEADYDPIIAVLDNWWGARRISHLLPRIFFIHFRTTSFAIEEDGKPIGFLAGFVSQAYPDQAYIYFVGIHPNYRGQGLGCRLYTSFFDAVRKLGCSVVRCITSPVNTGSIAFHMRMGFQVENATGEYQGIPCSLNYELGGEHRVLFVKSLS
jgi:ribosomal protein S18 acetylase RimI-like enzyme